METNQEWLERLYLRMHDSATAATVEVTEIAAD
jgi:hypothetical protein